MLTPIIKRLIEAQITKLTASNDTLVRQIQFYRQRGDDYQTLLTNQVKEIIELKSFLGTLQAATLTPTVVHEPSLSQMLDGLVEETRRGLTDPDGWED